MAETIESAVLEEIGRTVVDVPMHQQRSLATVTAEIRAYQDAARRMAITYCIEVGRRLVEAKSMVNHGEWGSYLRTELGFSQSRANDLMRIFEAYAADQMRLDGDNLKSKAFGNLSYTQALALLALPSEEEREAFVEEHDMTKISTRQLQEDLLKRKQEPEDGEEPSGISGKLEEALEKLRTAEEDRDKAEAGEDKEFQRANALKIERDQMRDQLTASQNERNKAQAAAEAAAERAAQAEKKADEAAQRASDLQTELDKARKAEDKAKRELEKAKANKTAPPEVLEKLRKEAEAAAEARHKADSEELKAAKDQCVKAEMDVDAARREAARAREAAERLEKELELAAPEMAVFKASFERVQKDLLALVGSIDGLPEDKRAGCWKAMAALVGQISRIVEGHTKGVEA